MGEDDNRYLWPALFRLVQDVKPEFCCFENVAGLVSMEDGKTLDGILLDLEGEGYETEQFIIPACGVGAWHRRDRIWILAYTSNGTDRADRGEKGETESISGKHRQTRCTREPCGTDKDASNSNSRRIQRYRRKGIKPGIQAAESNQNNCKRESRSMDSEWWESESNVGRVANGIPRKLDKIIDYETIKKELLELWQRNDPTCVEKWGERFNIQEQEILQLSMLWILDREEIQCKENEWEKNCSTKIQINGMREMWVKKIITEASQRWESKQQYEGQYYDSMSTMPQGGTFKSRHMGYIWNEEPNIPRVAIGIRNRINRLKGLGNAIVPQVAFEIFKAIEDESLTLT